jgi:hypothetical protein
VTRARPLDKSASGSAEAGSMRSIVFDKAVLRDGREVPLNATIQAVSAAQSAASLDSGLLQREDGRVSAPYDAITAEMRL